MKQKKTILRRLYPGFLGIIFLSAAGITWHAATALRDFYFAETRRELLAIARLAASEAAERMALQGVEAAEGFCKRAGRAVGRRKTRFTVILLDGKVIGDSEHDPATMVNHSDRPEIRQALESGDYGSSARFSTTLGMPMMYVAVPLRVGGQIRGVMRVSRPLERIRAIFRRLLLALGVGGTSALLLGAAAAYLFARHISRPLQDMREAAERLGGDDLDFRVAEPDTLELAALSRALNRMGERLRRTVDALTRERNELRAILRGMGEGLIALDGERRVLAVNAVAARMLELQDAEVRGKPLLELTRTAGLIQTLDALEKRGGAAETEIVLPGQNGERILHVHGALMKEKDSVGGAVLILRDITRLRRSEQARRDFVADVSHELKTPLTSLRGFIETLREGAIEDPKAARRFLEILERQSARMQAIIEDLLLLTRLERDADEGALDRREQPARALLERAAQICQARAEAKKIRLDVSCPEELRLFANPGLIEQALVNLIDNAITHSPEGAPVRIEAEKCEGEVLLRVRDRGCGIPRIHLTRIFQRFYRVDKARSRKGGGAGLGLAIVKHIALAHGGRVEVESAPGEGSAFTLRLPRPPAPNDGQTGKP